MKDQSHPATVCHIVKKVQCPFGSPWIVPSSCSSVHATAPLGLASFLFQGAVPAQVEDVGPGVHCQRAALEIGGLCHNQHRLHCIRTHNAQGEWSLLSMWYSKNWAHVTISTVFTAHRCRAKTHWHKAKTRRHYVKAQKKTRQRHTDTVWKQSKDT